MLREPEEGFKRTIRGQWRSGIQIPLYLNILHRYNTLITALAMIVRQLLAFYCVALGLAGAALGAPTGEASVEKRQAGQLITQCTVPNTVGMTFVSEISYRLKWC